MQLLRIYNAKGDLYKGRFLLISLSINCVFILVLNLIAEEFHTIIVNLVDLYIAVIPSLLGFNLGAYALLVGLGSSHLIEKLSATYETKFTSFQRASSVFGFCVLLQAIALIVAFFCKMFIIIGETPGITLPSFLYDLKVVYFINTGCLFFLNWIGIYSILILLSVIGSIFAISQASHFYAVTGHMKAENIAKSKKVKFTLFISDYSIRTSKTEIEGLFEDWGTTSVLKKDQYIKQTVAIIKTQEGQIYQVLPENLVFG